MFNSISNHQHATHAVGICLDLGNIISKETSKKVKLHIECLSYLNVCSYLNLNNLNGTMDVQFRRF